MSKQRDLNAYIARLRQRLQLRGTIRGFAILFGAALVYTVGAVLLLNHFAFPHAAMMQARAYLIAVLLTALCFGLTLPVLWFTTARAVGRAEARHPALEDRLTTFHERKQSRDPFLELLAADTLTRAADAPAASLAPAPLLAAWGGVGLASLGVLLWMIFAAPGYLGYGASLLWTGERKTEQPLYALTVAPGDVAVRRNSDQLITAEVTNLHPDKVQIFAHFNSSSGWEPVAMQRQAGTGSSYGFVFTGLPENVEYYVAAGPLTSPHYKVRVVDLPFVKSVKVTYHYPKWTGMKTVSEDHAGDLRAIEGTQAELEFVMDRPLKNGNLTLDNGQTVHLTGGDNNRYTGTVAMNKDGAYHVAATDAGQPVRLSEDYFIATDKAEPPQIALEKPGRDYRASPIEEVTVGVKGGAQFGLRDMHLHYSVNGGPDKDVSLLKQPGAKDANGSYTLRLEDFRLQPGDLVSLYATAKDGHAEAKTDITFIQADPFEREFSQSQQGGGGGGGGGGQGNQTEISKREKELIGETWKEINNKGATEKTAKTQGDFLSGAQSKLRDQVMALSARMSSRDIGSANEEFTAFDKDMKEAAKNMLPASEKLSGTKWQDALVSEQKALQALLRAEATFRQIQVAYGQQQGGGGGGGSTGRDLASLFDLELDTEKNQYETARTAASSEEQHQKEVEDALAKLDALAKRQEELANQQKNPQQAFQERWQQEMLRREAEQLQRQMEQLAQDKKDRQGQSGQQGQQQGQQSSQEGQQSSQGGQQSASSSGSQPGSSSGQSKSQTSSGGGQSGSQQASSRQNGRAGQSGQSQSDQRIEQALSRMRAAEDAMKRSGASQGNGTEAQKQAAERLREATGLMGGAQQELAGNKLGSLSHEADRLQQEERAQAGRIDQYTQQTRNQNFDPDSYRAKVKERNQLSAERQELSNSLSKLQRDMRETARQMAGSQPATSQKLRDSLTDMDQSDLDTHVQRTADWLRSGINPNSNGTEKGIADGLGKLSQQLRAAEGTLGKGGAPGGRSVGPDKDQQTAALGQVERLRSQLEAMRAGSGANGRAPGQTDRNGQQPVAGGNAQGSQPGQQGQGNQPGGSQAGNQRGGQGSQQTASNGRNGQQGQGSQRGGSQQGQGGSQGQGGQQGQSGQPGQGQGQGAQQAGNRGGGFTRGNDIGGGADGTVRSGDIGRRMGGGGNDGTAWGNVNTGNNTYAQGGQRYGAKGTAGNPADTERSFQQSMRDLQTLRGMVKDDPQAAKEVTDLTRKMQGLDPNRFPGNPAIVEQMHSEVLRAVDRLELQLQRSAETDARTGKPDAIPAGYSDSVAEYYRRLSKSR